MMKLTRSLAPVRARAIVSACSHRMDWTGRLPRLIEQLYGAPGSVARWQRFLDALCDALDGSGAQFIIHHTPHRRSSVTIASRTPVEALESYVVHWAGQDPWAYQQAVRLLRAGDVVAGERLISDADMRRTPFFNDFSSRFDIGRSLTGIVNGDPRTSCVVSVNRALHAPAFELHDEALLRSLMPHLQRALQVHWRLTKSDAHAAVADDIMEALRCGVVVLSASGRVIHQNAEAKRIVAAADGIAIDNAELRAADADATAALRAHLADAARAVGGSSTRSVMHVGRPSGKLPWAVTALPVTRRSAPLFVDDDAAAIAVLINDTSRAAPSVESVRATLGLTVAEAWLACRLAEGCTLREAARESGLQESTLRTRLKAIFSKTGCRRQSDLVRRVLFISA